MPRRKAQFAPPFLHLYLQGEGETLLTVTVKKPVPITAHNVQALVRLNPAARKSAIAVTLIEVARSLLQEPSYETDLLNRVVSSLVLDDLPMQNFSIPDDFPF